MRVILLVTALQFLTGCWFAEEEQFLTESLLVSDLPDRMMVSYGGSTDIVKRKSGSIIEYEGFGFESLKFKRIKNGLFVQGFDEQTGKFHFFIVANNGDVSQQLRSRGQVALVLYHPDKPISVRDNNFGIKPIEVAGRNAFRNGSMQIQSLDRMSSDQVALLLQQMEREADNSRYDRSFEEALLFLCSKRRAISTSSNLALLLSKVYRQGEFCISENAFAKFQFGLSSIQNLNCEGSGEVKECTFTFSLTCLANTTVANNMRLNKEMCRAVEAMRQPARAQVKDNGKVVQFLSLELLQ